MELELRGLNIPLVKTKMRGRNETYYDKTNNNMIIFHPCHKDIDTDSICNSIRDKAYLYLMNELNENKNVTVFWSQVEGTTSDYNIYYDLNPNELKDKNYKEILELLPNIETIFAYKYVEVKNGIERKITETIEL